MVMTIMIIVILCGAMFYLMYFHWLQMALCAHRYCAKLPSDTMFCLMYSHWLQMALCAHRYCAKLPSDTFTHLTPKCRLEAVSDDNTNYQAVIRLPINSPVKYPIKVSECFCQVCISQLLQINSSLATV